MKEKLIDIVTDIDSCAKARKSTRVYPIARIHCLFDGKEDTYWLCEDYHSAHEIGEIVKFGHFVPRYSNAAIEMQKLNVGQSFDYDTAINKYRSKHHHVELENRSDFQNQTIAIAGDEILYQFRNISEFLVELRKNKEDIEEIESQIAEHKRDIENLKKQEGTAAQRSQITRTIKERLKEYLILTQQQEDLKNITIYIRKQGEMRYTLIVDPIQTRIQSQNLYDGTTIIINGGPGTGKSTTMIHRLAYLTDLYAINEDEKKGFFNYKLDQRQRNLLREAIATNRDWMFFSPSQLLKEYLAAAMKKEGLKNTSEKVWNWKDYCRLILKENYGLLGSTESNSPFKVCYIEGTLFFQNSGIIKELTAFYLKQLQEINEHLPKLNEGGTVYRWTSIARGIAQRLESCNTFDIQKFVSVFNTLESVYANDCKELLKEKDIAIIDLANEICNILNTNKDARSEIMDIMDFSDTEDSDDSEKQETTDTTNSSNKLLKEVQKWLKSYSLSCVDQDYQMPDELLLINDVVLPLLGEYYDDRIKKIGELIVFEQYAKYTYGSTAIMLKGIPELYKKFRRHLKITQFKGCNLPLLQQIVERKQGKELHHQELSLLLGFINSLVKEIKKTGNVKNKHRYITAYEDVARPIIGVDEATDFSDCDIYAIQSLLSTDFNSFTLCGDMMQRLTTYGIQSWNELDGVVSNPKVVEMKTSYRQSKKLLEVAKKMYIDTLGKTPSYKAFMKSEKVPAPLIYIDKNETAKIEWMSKRISEVYRAYGEQLPSIAIFVNDQGYIPNFSKWLEDTDFFKEHGIKVIEGTKGTTTTEGTHICVYPIDVVKGMEFDVVFFHNIDNASVDNEILKRYIYVGVSRAAFFLGITLSENNPEISKYFVQKKDWFKI